MNYKIADVPLEFLTTEEIAMLRRMASRYAEIMQERAYLVGLTGLAMRAGDTNLLALAKHRLAEVEKQRSECFSGLQGERRVRVSAGASGENGGVAA
jgi:hypothetical protein